ncbi:DUF4376 domain-containing protein [Xanthobacter sediminis]
MAIATLMAGNLWTVTDEAGAHLMQIAAPAGADAAAVLAIYEEVTGVTAPTVEAVRADALTRLAGRRWRAETGGIVVGGTAIPTDEQAQLKITGAALAAQRDPTMSLLWKCTGGVWVTLTAAQVLALADAVRAHVQACFDREATLAGALTAAETVEAVAAIDIETGWPPTGA